MQYPVHVYRSPGNYELRGKSYRVASVDGPELLQEHLASGWHISMDEAFRAAGDAAIVRRKVADWRLQKKASKRRAEFRLEKAKARAVKLAQAPVVEAVVGEIVEPDDAPPTRVEMEDKARELGIRFDGRTSDARLLAKIGEALRTAAPAAAGLPDEDPI